MADRAVLVLATGNEKKKKELVFIAGDDFEVRSLRDLVLLDVEIIEDADTFAGNAEKKARTILRALTERDALTDVIAVLADDSGLCVDALNGAPGVRSARFASDHDAGEGDEPNNDLLLAQLADVKDPARTAHFACAICVALVDGRTLETFGRVEGRIGDERRGDGGFGYDPLFFPDERPEVTTAELSPTEKHAISHRGRAVREAMKRLRAELA